ncbi:helix-turn-helix domain-containing protein [Niveispirillum fermenti]|uniref:helix-turn-helix domain-containing protein n=1 Tax=Niveispirillum fermenti TaxID=1233113 RepID=UPI003A8950F8
MGKAYSGDLRERVEARIAAGYSRREASRHFGVSASFAVKLAQRVAVTGSVAPGRQGRPPGHGKLADCLPQLIAWVEAMPDISMPELAAKLEASTGVVAHPASLSRALLKAGFSTKKRCWHPSANALMSERIGRSGGRTVSPGCAKNPIAWCSSTRRRRPRR